MTRLKCRPRLFSASFSALPAAIAVACLSASAVPSARAQPEPSALVEKAAPSGGDVFAEGLRAYHAALLARRLGEPDLRREEIAARVAEGEQLVAAGRVDEAIARLGELVERPRFADFFDSEEGRAAVFRLGDALAVAKVDVPARAYLRRVLEAKDAWAGRATWARRAVRRLVDLALDSGELEGVAGDLAGTPATAPEEVRGEIAYMNGRAKEVAGDPEGALASYAQVTQRCRFWAQATYLSALIDVEQGKYKDGENLLCRVADPGRSATTTPVFADEKFFAVRDLARLGLGRIAHEEGRNDDARYYYYLVPRDSDRLAEAVYEAATTRYEKKDYDGANELLAELSTLAGSGAGVHHRYEDEAWVLGAWVDLARCRFEEADKKLVGFVARYEPVRDAARRVSESPRSMQRLLAAVHAGTDAAGAEVGGVSPDAIRAVAALVRVDPAYDRVVRRRAVLERQASGLVHAMAAIGDMQRGLATNGGVRPALEAAGDETRAGRDVRDAMGGVEREITELEAGGAPADRIAPLRRDLASLEARLGPSERAPVSGADPGAGGVDLPDLLRADATKGTLLASRLAASRREIAEAESALAKDALHRLDLRLSRLLRRARLGRIESVLGRKRALEVDVEAIRLGYLPKDAVDSMDAARYLEDGEEYWPFEGDDWPDEYVGSESK
jgi:tetratricopeptide (TPR) repeat protein